MYMQQNYSKIRVKYVKFLNKFKKQNDEVMNYFEDNERRLFMAMNSSI